MSLAVSRASRALPRRARGAEARSKARRGLARRCVFGLGERSGRDPLYIGHHRPAQGRGPEPRQRACHRAQCECLRQNHRARRDHRLSANGLGRRSHFQLRAGARGGILRRLPRKPADRGRGPPRDRPNLFLRASARLREPADLDHGAHGGCGLDQAHGVQSFHGRRKARWRTDFKRRAGLARHARSLWPRTRSGLRTRQEPPRADPDPRRLHGGRGDRARDLPLLPLARAEPETVLRADRSQRLRHAAIRWRDRRGHGGQARARRRDPHVARRARSSIAGLAFSSATSKTARPPKTPRPPMAG